MLLQSAFAQVVNGKAGCQSAREYNEICWEFQEGQLPINIVICLMRRTLTSALAHSKYTERYVSFARADIVDSLFKCGVFGGGGTKAETDRTEIPDTQYNWQCQVPQASRYFNIPLTSSKLVHKNSSITAFSLLWSLTPALLQQTHVRTSDNQIFGSNMSEFSLPFTSYGFSCRTLVRVPHVSVGWGRWITVFLYTCFIFKHPLTMTACDVLASIREFQNPVSFY